MIRSLARVLPVALLGAGCYTYTPVDTATVAPSMTVRVDVGGAAVEERVEGQVFEVGRGSLVLLPEARPGADTSPRTLSFGDIESISQRQFHTQRTLALVGAGMAVGVGVLLLTDGNPADDPGGPGGPGDFNVLPVLRALLSLGR